MDIILIPGLWLNGSSWERVVPVLEAAGHRAHAMTLPGMETATADRSGITLRDHVDAVVAQLDALARGGGRVVVVGHSAGAAIAHAAIDARPEHVACAVYVGGFPTGHGDAIADGFSARNGEVPLPDWADFDDEELAGLDEAARAWFRERAIPSPERVTRDPQQLTDERRYDVPVTVIAPEFTADMLREWMGEGLAPVRELTRIRSVEVIDLPTGHWPQFSRPTELARAILGVVDRVGDVSGSSPAASSTNGGVIIDEQGRPEPPVTGDELATLVGFLEFQRATLAWKCDGLGPQELQATVGASTMTLGGLLKHMAYVEDAWFARRLHGHDRIPPWDAIDWEADPDWDWHSAADDTPAELRSQWREAVERSRSLLAEALERGGLDQLAAQGWADGTRMSLRWILVHMVEEYARHNGHADLIRESIDGATGE